MKGKDPFTRLAKTVLVIGSAAGAAAVIRLAFTLWMRKARRRKFAIPKEHAITDYIDTTTIVYAEGADNYTQLYCLNGEALQMLLLSRTLKSVEEELCRAGFIRPCKSYIFNLEHIRRIDTAQNTVIVVTDKKIKVTNEAASILKAMMDGR